MSQPVLYTTAKVAEILEVSEQTVRDWLRRGVLSGIRLGGNRYAQWRIRDTDLEEFLEGCTEKAS